MQTALQMYKQTEMPGLGGYYTKPQAIRAERSHTGLLLSFISASWGKASHFKKEMWNGENEAHTQPALSIKVPLTSIFPLNYLWERVFSLNASCQFRITK